MVRRMNDPIDPRSDGILAAIMQQFRPHEQPKPAGEQPRE
jgi:hypothetical protein